MTRSENYQAARGIRQEMRILASLKESPKTSKQLAESLSIGLSNVSIYTCRLREAGQIHIGTYAPVKIGRPAPLWALGDGVDAVYEAKRKQKQLPVIESRMVKVRAFLTEPRTALELANHLCVTPGRARFYLKLLREEQGVFICDWRHPGKRGDRAPVYKIGRKFDIPKFGETRAERYRKEMADPDKKARIIAKRQARDNIIALRKKPQGIFAALGL